MSLTSIEVQDRVPDRAGPAQELIATHGREQLFALTRRPDALVAIRPASEQQPRRECLIEILGREVCCVVVAADSWLLLREAGYG